MVLMKNSGMINCLKLAADLADDILKNILGNVSYTLREEQWWLIETYETVCQRCLDYNRVVIGIVLYVVFL